MSDGPPGRMIGHLVYGDVAGTLREGSVLCLPMGSMEQHGPHLPLNTDCIIAEGLTARIVARWGKAHDVWQLPLVPIGLSREHAWAPGTLSLTVSGMTAYLRDFGKEIARSLPARNLMIVNGHGGNRGILDALTQEMRTDFGLNIVTLQLGAMMSHAISADAPDIHAGKDETSVMLALAPNLVRADALASLKSPPGRDAINDLVLDPAASYPWSSGDPRLSEAGVMGDARGASVALGESIIARVVEDAGEILKRLKANAAPARA